MGNIMVIGKGKKSWMSLPKEQGLYLSALEKKLDTEKNKKKWGNIFKFKIVKFEFKKQNNITSS